VPWLIRYVQDRDLWQFQYDETKNINAALFSYDFDFALWSELQSYCGELGELGEEGEVLLRAHDKAVREMCCHEFRTVRFFSSLNAEEIHVPFINCPASLASDVGNVLALKHPVVALYFDTATHRAVSLRSSKENPSHLDVSAIAAGFGGGGHKHAAGFRVPLNWEGE
jgi:nanoRNase/pAp phosphatase (c-di-AMP/oligoRNAs hydrolase)